MNVSVIIPAHNAAGTIGETLDSLRAQTFQNWEAIVVDDGSRDETVAIVTRLSEQDNRIRIVSQPQIGVSAARNRGIRLSRFDWLLFLDADDWILPPMLERLTNKAASDAGLDIVYCSWARVAPDGRRFGEEFLEHTGNFFEVFSRTCAFAIHACIVRKACVEALGGFNTSLQTCEDWYLWQRIARNGARFGSVRETLSLYRMRYGSASMNGYRLLADGIRVQAWGHAPDPSVPNQAYPKGQPAERLPMINFYLACWSAGLALGSGEDARPLLDMLKKSSYPILEPHGVASSIFKSALLPSCRVPADWVELLHRFEKNIKEFLQALEERSMTPGLARSAQIILENLILERSTAPMPLAVGTRYVVQIEVTKPICDITPPSSAERLRCVVELEGKRIGVLELPICDGMVSGYVLVDAIAAKFAWQILDKFFQHTIYRNFILKRHRKGFSILRGTMELAKDLKNNKREIWLQIHDKIGWAVFLQELWGYPDWPECYFYPIKWNIYLRLALKSLLKRVCRGFSRRHMPFPIPATPIYQCLKNERITIEISKPLPDIKTTDKELGILVTMAGATLGVIAIPVKGNIVRSGDIRVAITSTCGYELCRMAVREALLGKSIADPISLRDRLSDAFDQHFRKEKTANAPENDDFIPDSVRAIIRALRPNEAGIALTRRVSGLVGTSISRRASLPRDTAGELFDVASVAGELIIRIPGNTENEEHLVYSPELICYPSPDVQESSQCKNLSQQPHLTDTQLFDQRDSETIIEEKPNSWNGMSPQKQEGYEQASFVHPSIPAIHGLVNKPGQTNFGSDDIPLEANIIGKTSGDAYPLQLVKELKTPRRHIQFFQYARNSHTPSVHNTPATIKTEKKLTPVSQKTAAQMRRHTHNFRKSAAPSNAVTDRLPILMYHRVAPVGLASMSRYRVTPEVFEEQIRYLYNAGFYSVDLEDWRQAMMASKPLPGRAILITFDDGYMDFFTFAWPILQRYGFTAVVFLVANEIGGINQWDRALGEEAPLLGWKEIHLLQEKGVRFGSHSVSHPLLTNLSVRDIVREGLRSRAILERGIGTAVNAFAYPYGDTDEVVQHLIGACGYIFGLTCREYLSNYHNSLLALPRLEITGSDTMENFITKLGISPEKKVREKFLSQRRIN